MAKDTKQFSETEIDIVQSLDTEQMEGLNTVFNTGVEQKTNGIWINGSIIYREVVDFGSISSGDSTKSVDMITSHADIDQIVDIRPIFSNGYGNGGDIYIGNLYQNNSGGVDRYLWWRVTLGSPNVVYLNTEDLSNGFTETKVIVEYTRTDK